MEWQVAVSNQVATVAAGMQWSGSPFGLWAWLIVQPGSSVGGSEFWVLVAYKGWVPTHQCQMESYRSGFEHSRPLPRHSYYIKFPQSWHSTWHNCRADSDSVLDCQKCSISPPCSRSIQAVHLNVSKACQMQHSQNKLTSLLTVLSNYPPSIYFTNKT